MLQGRVVSLSALELLFDSFPPEVWSSLDHLGRDTGRRLIERLSADKIPRLLEPLDAVKFLSKDVWSVVFGKPLDNLKTNHKGTFVLTDNDFSWLRHSSKTFGERRLTFVSGLIQGALEGLMGVPLTVSMDVSARPTITFQVRLVQSSSSSSSSS